MNLDPDYSERPKAPPLPAELEAQLGAAGCKGRDYGILTHVGPLRDEIAESDIEPMHTGNPDFDWDKVFLELDGELPADDETNRRAMQIAAETLKRIFTWMIGPDKIHAPEIKTVGTRAVAALWVLNPHRFGDGSLREVANFYGFKGASSLSPFAAEFTRLFKVRNRYQAHCSRKEIYDPARN